MSSFSTAQLSALALLPKLTGWSSLLFSSALAAHILRQPRLHNSSRLSCYHRLMLGVSAADISASFWHGMSTWPVPAASAMGVWAAGSETTCRLQGFFTQNSLISSFYNASLSVYFYLVICRGWNETALQRIEWPVLHGIPLAAGALTSVLGLALHAYGDALLWCWVSADHQVFRWAAYYVPLWTNIFIVTAACAAIYQHVRVLEQQEIITRNNNAVATTSRTVMDDTIHTNINNHSNHRPLGNNNNNAEQEQGEEEEDQALGQPSAINDVSDEDQARGMANHSNPQQQQTSDNDRETARTQSPPAASSSSHASQPSQTPYYTMRHNKRVKQVAQQCFLYAAAFYVNWTSLTAVRLIQAFGDASTVPYSLILISAITVPMQGLPNFLVYLRPKLQKAYRHWRVSKARATVVWNSRGEEDTNGHDMSMSRRHTTTPGNNDDSETGDGEEA